MVNTFLKDVAVKVQSFHNDLPYTSALQMYITFFFFHKYFIEVNKVQTESSVL